MAGILMDLKNVRICYAQNIFKPSAYKEGQDVKYNAQFIISDPEQLKAAQKVCLDAAEMVWPKMGAKVIKELEGGDFLCLRDGDKKPDREEVAGLHYLAASNRKRPTIINRDRSPVAEEDGIIYSGCTVNAKIEIYGFPMEKGKKGVFATLMGVQFVKDGDAFSGIAKTVSADEFDDIADTGADDDIGL